MTLSPRSLAAVALTHILRPLSALFDRGIEGTEGDDE